MKLSKDFREMLKEICSFLNNPYRNTKMFVSMRWLSVRDVSVSATHMFVAHLLFYYGVLTLKINKFINQGLN